MSIPLGTHAGELGQAATTGPLAFPPFTRARQTRAGLATTILRSGRAIPDDAFDEVYPDPIRHISSTHWTPVAVAIRIAELLRLGPESRLLDIGAGAGKLCIIAAAVSGAHVRGVERERDLAQVAREAARRLAVTVEIVEGTFDEENPEAFDALYLFNPFLETIVLPGMEVPSDRFAGRTGLDVNLAERFLERTRVGTRLVCFHGFGGIVPSTYERIAIEAWERGYVELWEKRRTELVVRGSGRAER